MLMNRQPTNYGANISWLVTECSQLFNESLLRNDVDFFFVWKMRPLSSTIQCKHNFNFHSVRVLHLHQYRRKVVLIEFSNIWKISEMINEQKKNIFMRECLSNSYRGAICMFLISFVLFFVENQLWFRLRKKRFAFVLVALLPSSLPTQERIAYHWKILQKKDTK